MLTAIIYEAALKHIESSSPDLTYPLLNIPGLINDPTIVKEYLAKIEQKLTNEKKITFSARDIERYLPKEIDFNNSIITPTFAKPKDQLKMVILLQIQRKSNLKMDLLLQNHHQQLKDQNIIQAL